MEIPDREPDGEFSCFQTWVNKAPSWIGGTNPLCADAKNRICKNGGDMKRAEKEGAFPVRFWYGEGDLTPKQQRKAKRNHESTMRMLYPWRF